MSFLQKNRPAFLLMFLGLILIAVGVQHQELQTIFQKASRVCMECIGLG